MNEKAETRPIPKEIQDAWNIVAKYLHDNQVSSAWLDTELCEAKTVTIGKRPFTCKKVVFYYKYTLRDFENLKFTSKPYLISDKYLEKGRKFL